VTGVQTCALPIFLAGSGPDRERIEALIRELNLEENVTLAGRVADNELPGFYQLCDVFAMPSKGEGFGIVFLEAMACGKPVIAGNKDGSVDAVLNGRLGVLVDPDNVVQIAEALIAILARKGAEPKEKGEKLEIRDRSLETRSRKSDSSASIPEIIFDPQTLRREVIATYGYDRFLEILRGILSDLPV